MPGRVEADTLVLGGMPFAHQIFGLSYILLLNGRVSIVDRPFLLLSTITVAFTATMSNRSITRTPVPRTRLWQRVFFSLLIVCSAQTFAKRGGLFSLAWLVQPALRPSSTYRARGWTVYHSRTVHIL